MKSAGSWKIMSSDHTKTHIKIDMFTEATLTFTNLIAVEHKYFFFLCFIEVCETQYIDPYVSWGLPA